MKVRFAHTNLVARNWRTLSRFYIDVFGCEPKPPLRNLRGRWVDRLTSLNHARVRGIHLLLPGRTPHGPTLEIFEYSPAAQNRKSSINMPGFGHIAFEVTDVERMRESVLAHGGSTVGEVVQASIKGAGSICVVYVRDPESNIVELQRWDRSPAPRRNPGGKRRRTTTLGNLPS